MKYMILLLLNCSFLFSMSGYIETSFLNSYGIRVNEEKIFCNTFQTEVHLEEQFKQLTISTDLNTLMIKQDNTAYFMPFNQQYILTGEYEIKNFIIGVSHMCSHPVLTDNNFKELESCYNKLYIRYNF